MSRASGERSEVVYGTTRIAYTVERTRRRKTVAVCVDDRGRVALKAPVDTPADRLARIVRDKARWIVERQRRQEETLPGAGAREFVSGETFRYVGRGYRLMVREGEARSVKLARGRLVVRVEAARADERAARVRGGLVAWYREHAARRLPERVAVWAPRLGVAPAEVRVREQKKRWGSCDARGVIRLNWRIIQAPLRLQDYVVVHELAHLRERDHSREFWALVGHVMPDYDTRRETLRRLGSELVW